MCGRASNPAPRRYDALVSEYDHARTAETADRGDDPFPGAAHLDRAALIRAVIARNPDVAAARAAWRAALARYPEETAIEDPIVSHSFPPLTVRDDRLGQSIEVDQKLPTPRPRAPARGRP